jgi:hypothetical protein
MPDPLWYFKSNVITGVIKVESGGELVLVTADPNGLEDLHPWIGTSYTMTQGAPVGADFVMDPELDSDSKIEVRSSSGISTLELTGNAYALGRLILDKNYKQNSKIDPPYRFEIWLTYPFTVTQKSNLIVGITGEVNLRTSLLVTGMIYSTNTPSPPLPPKNGISFKGVLTNNGDIYVHNQNGIMEWFGGYFDHNDHVYKAAAPTTPISVHSGGHTFTGMPSSPIPFKVWSPDPEWAQWPIPLPPWVPPSWN